MFGFCSYSNHTGSRASTDLRPLMPPCQDVPESSTRVYYYSETKKDLGFIMDSHKSRWQDKISCWGSASSQAIHVVTVSFGLRAVWPSNSTLEPCI